MEAQKSLIANQLQAGDYTDPQKKNCSSQKKYEDIPLKP